jgi:predicted AAA+ superfamily ATPase
VWASLGETGPGPLWLNCEEPLMRLWCRSPAVFAAQAKRWLEPGGTLILEEAPALDEAGLFIKGLVDYHTGWRILVTGSSSFHLLAKTRESLAGRATRHSVWPLSLVERLDAVGVDALTAPGPRRVLAVEQTRDALIYGGYPGVLRAPDRQRELVELREAFVMRDASDRFRIERPDALRKLLRLAACQVGDLVNASEWSRVLGVSASTVQDYLGLLEETHVLRLITPFVGPKPA